MKIHIEQILIDDQFFVKITKSENFPNDIWGDFNIIFASSFIGGKIIDLPVRYYERVQGVSKMRKRFFNFLNMMKVCLQVFKCFKFKNRLV